LISVRFTENVIEFLVEQIKKLPQDAQTVAQTAACLGSKFNSAAILEILEEDMVSSNLPLLISNGKRKKKKKERIIIL
jgi:predicted ATPase